MWARLATAMAALALGLSPAPPTIERGPAGSFPAANRPPVHVGGRVKIERGRGGPPVFAHEWPGVYFEAAFNGDAVVLRFDDPDNEYRLLIDRLVPITIAQPGRTDIRVSGLGDGPHRARLEKVTESIGRVGRFAGFGVPSGERARPVGARSRRIEFIGDSSMAGYGDRSPTRQCTSEEVRLRTDTQAAYPALVARHFGADYQINAMSGRGMVRNFHGVAPDAPLPRVYDRLLPSEAGTAPKWRPQIIVIKLNADFADPVHPGERWTSEDALMADYVAAFGRFVAAVHERAPEAAILIWWFDPALVTDPGMRATIDGAERTIRQVAARAGVRTIDFLPLKNLGFDQSACDYHPSLADHRKTAAWLIDYLDRHPDDWRGAASAGD